MSARLENIEFKKRNFAPGPGNYEIHNMPNTQHRFSPKFSIGKEPRGKSSHMKEQRNKPGAGTHSVFHNTYTVLKKKAPSFGFGTSQRPDITGKAKTSPGPGAYRVPTQLANVATYSQAHPQA